MSLPCVGKKGLGVHLKAAEYQEGQDWMKQSRRERGCVASAKDTHTINSALQKMQQAIKVASAT